MKATTFKDLANHEIVTLAVYLLAGDSQRIDTEDIAKKAAELAPGRFTWRKYPDQTNIDTVRKRLSEGASLGRLVVKDSQAWGLGPLFSRRGGVPGDSLRILFDLKAKIATADLEPVLNF